MRCIGSEILVEFLRNKVEIGVTVKVCASNNTRTKCKQKVPFEKKSGYLFLLVILLDR